MQQQQQSYLFVLIKTDILNAANRTTLWVAAILIVILHQPLPELPAAQTKPSTDERWLKEPQADRHKMYRHAGRLVRVLT